jgi:hypothetical protein
MAASWHRDGCVPQRLASGGYAATDLFWFGSQAVARATVVAVHYRWEGGPKVWRVTSAEMVANDILHERHSGCSTLDLSSLAGIDP